jgi:hypothetical protein
MLGRRWVYLASLGSCVKDVRGAHTPNSNTFNKLSERVKGVEPFARLLNWGTKNNPGGKVSEGIDSSRLRELL